MMRWLLGLLSAAALATVLTLLASRGTFVHVEDVPAGWRAGTEAFPEGPLRILAVGTSLTANSGWPAALKVDLQERRPGSSVEVLAMAGASSAWGAPALTKRLQSGPPPDVVLIEFSINDASLGHGMAMRAARERHRQMIRDSRKAGAVPVLMVMSPAFGSERWERPGLPAYQQDYRRMRDVALVDLIGRWKALPREEARALVPDGVHPTDDAWNRLLLPELAGLLHTA